MIEGIIFDNTRYGPSLPAWQPGKPERTWRGFKRKKTRSPITTFRCESCGYLESYASIQ